MLLALSVSVEAQQPKKVPRIGYLAAGDPASESTRSEPIRQALRERGYIEGQNISIEYRYGEGSAIGLLTSRPSWCVSRLISSWYLEEPGWDSGGQECDQGDSHRDAEFAERNTADLVWMSEGFDFAKRNGSKAIMIITQANPGFQNTWPEVRFRRYMLNSPIKPPEKKIKTAYDEFLAALETETLAFPKPVVLVRGDSHIFRIDQPLLSSKTGRVIENFTRVETFGTPDVHWSRVMVNLDDPNVFTFKPEIVKKNLVDHSKR